MLNEVDENLDELDNRQEVSPEALNELAKPLDEVRQRLKQQKHLKTASK